MIAGAMIRLWHCLSLPESTGDLLRHIMYGLLVNRYGWSIAGIPLGDLGPAYKAISWSWVDYSYPIIPLAFFTGLATLWPSMLFAKFSLTLCEVINAWMIYWYSRDRKLSLLYWLWPSSLLWVSREGQFEPLQTVFTIAALLALQKRLMPLAWALLCLAIQVKYSAIVLVPWFVHQSLHTPLRTRIFVAGALLLALLPSFIQFLVFKISLMEVLRLRNPMDYNPYYFVFLDDRMARWNPAWMRVCNQLASFGMLLLLLVLLYRGTVAPIALAAPLLFLILLKLHHNVQSWYVCLFPAFLLPIASIRWRRILFAALYTLDVFAVVEQLNGPLYQIGNYHGNLTASSLISLPPALQ